MLHKYRKTALIEAEKFDGSKEQVKRYQIIALGTLQDGCVYTGCPCILKTKEGGMNLKYLIKGYKPIKRTRKRQIAKAKHMMAWHDHTSYEWSQWWHKKARKPKRWKK